LFYEFLQGAARRGRARRGLARRGRAWQGKGCFQRRAGNRSPVQIVSMLGMARRGTAWQGKAGRGAAGRGRARAVFSGKGSLFPMQTANMED